MRRSTFRVAILSFLVVAGAARAATPGFTDENRRRALDFARNLIEPKNSTVDREQARGYAAVYLRRAYAVDIKPAEALALIVNKKDYRLKTAERQQYLAWGLDALVRGAALSDVQTVLTTILGESMHNDADRNYYLEVLLKTASWSTSPIPILDLMTKAENDGTVGRRLRDLVSWAMGQVLRGESPVYIKQLYDAITAVTPLGGPQREFLNKCYALIENRTPPRGLAMAATRLSAKFHSVSSLEDALNNVILRYRAGASFADALNAVAPPPKIEDENAP